MRATRYLGTDILPTAMVSARHPVYIARTDSTTGLALDESLCPQFPSLAAAKRYLKDERDRSRASHQRKAATART